MPTMTKNRTCKSNKTLKSSTCASNDPVHVPMDDPGYDIEVIRAALGSVLGPMGYTFRVRPQSNETLGHYASISVSKKSN